jgi:hypothetical protein
MGPSVASVEAIEGTAREAVPSRQDNTGALATLADDAKLVQFVPERPDRTEFRIAPEDQANGLSLDLVHDQLAVLDVISQWDIAAHPHALGLGCRDLVANALTGNLTLELSEREKQ